MVVGIYGRLRTVSAGCLEQRNATDCKDYAKKDGIAAFACPFSHMARFYQFSVPGLLRTQKPLPRRVYRSADWVIYADFFELASLITPRRAVINFARNALLSAGWYWVIWAS